MLNVTSRISLSRSSKKNIKKYIRKNSLDSTTWDSITKSVKHDISKKLLYNQGPVCVYCERYLIGEKNEIDHFAHKGKYWQFTFCATNLFYACNYCNSYVKNQRRTITGVINQNYRLCNFKIVHPYLHNPDTEIFFKDAERVDLDWSKCTQLGIDTIKFWKWDEFIMTDIRATNALRKRLNPLTSLQEIELIQQIIAYK